MIAFLSILAMQGQMCSATCAGRPGSCDSGDDTSLMQIQAAIKHGGQLDPEGSASREVKESQKTDLLDGEEAEKYEEQSTKESQDEERGGEGGLLELDDSDDEDDEVDRAMEELDGETEDEIDDSMDEADIEDDDWCLYYGQGGQHWENYETDEKFKDTERKRDKKAGNNKKIDKKWKKYFYMWDGDVKKNLLQVGVNRSREAGDKKEERALQGQIYDTVDKCVPNNMPCTKGPGSHIMNWGHNLGHLFGDPCCQHPSRKPSDTVFFTGGDWDVSCKTPQEKDDEVATKCLPEGKDGFCLGTFKNAGCHPYAKYCCWKTILRKKKKRVIRKDRGFPNSGDKSYYIRRKAIRYKSCLNRPDERRGKESKTHFTNNDKFGCGANAKCR